jgi:NADH-quinone oxidoreductase subunit E
MIDTKTLDELREIAGRYPQARSGLLPMLHLLQSVQGHVSSEGIAACADILELTTAEVTGVVTFYTMYHSEPQGQHHIGVCINPGCAILGGDAVYAAVSERLGIDHDEVTADGKFSLERIECQAACTHAPAMTVNWEFMDLVTPESAVNTIDKLANGESVESTRGPVVGTWRDTVRVLAGFDDGKTDEGVAADELMLAGLKRAKELGMTAPSMTNGASHAEAGQ